MKPRTTYACTMIASFKAIVDLGREVMPDELLRLAKHADPFVAVRRVTVPQDETFIRFTFSDGSEVEFDE